MLKNLCTNNSITGNLLQEPPTAICTFCIITSNCYQSVSAR